MQCHHILHRGPGEVEIVHRDDTLPDALVVCDVTRRGALDMPDDRRFGGPGRAQDALVVAIEVAEFWRGDVGSEKGSRLVEAGFQLGAVPAAGLVAPRDENHPFCGAGASWVRRKEGLPIRHGDSVHGQGGAFRCGGLRWVLESCGDGRRRGHGGEDG